MKIHVHRFLSLVFKKSCPPPIEAPASPVVLPREALVTGEEALGHSTDLSGHGEGELSCGLMASWAKLIVGRFKVDINVCVGPLGLDCRICVRVELVLARFCLDCHVGQFHFCHVASIRPSFDYLLQTKPVRR